MNLDNENDKMLEYMDKSKLRTGMRVKTRSFGWFVVLRGVNPFLFRDTDVLVNDKSVWPLREWNDDLTYSEGKYDGYDIVAVTETNEVNMLVKSSPSGDLRKDERYVWVRQDSFKLETTEDIPYDYREDLRTGDLVEFRNGDRFVVIRNVRTRDSLSENDSDDILVKLPDFDDGHKLSLYEKDLRAWRNHDEDIVKVVRNSINTDYVVNVPIKRLLDKDRLDGLFKYGVILERSPENDMLFNSNQDDLPF